MASSKPVNHFRTIDPESGADLDDGPGGTGTRISIGGLVAEPRRIPRQARSQETVTAILQAAAQIIVEQGYDRASTNRIAARAGVSVGSLYQYFPNKAAILGALYQRHCEQVGEVMHTFLDRLDDPSAPLNQVLHSLFHDLVDAHRADPDLSRALSRETPQPAVAMQPGHEDTVPRVAAALRKRPEIKVRDLKIATLLLGEATEALSRWLVHDAPADLDIEVFIDEAVDMLAGYALGNRDGRGPGGASETYCA